MDSYENHVLSSESLTVIPLLPHVLLTPLPLTQFHAQGGLSKL